MFLKVACMAIGILFITGSAEAMPFSKSLPSARALPKGFKAFKHLINHSGNTQPTIRLRSIHGIKTSTNIFQQRRDYLKKQKDTAYQRLEKAEKADRRARDQHYIRTGQFRGESSDLNRIRQDWYQKYERYNNPALR